MSKNKLSKTPTQEDVDQANARMASFFAILPALLKVVVSSVICYPIFKGLLNYSSDQQIRWAGYGRRGRRTIPEPFRVSSNKT